MTTTLLVMILVLVVISLALDVLILASLGNLHAQLLPRKSPKATEEAIRKAIVESVGAMQAQAERRPKYDA